MIIELKLRGHILDSLVLSKLLDQIEALDVECHTKAVIVGSKRQDVSEAIFVIESDDESKIAQAIELAKKQGAVEV